MVSLRGGAAEGCSTFGIHGDPPGESLGGCFVNGGENNSSRKRREHISRILITADRCYNVAKTISMSISTLHVLLAAVQNY